jgi:hypothetical protein
VGPILTGAAHTVVWVDTHEAVIVRSRGGEVELGRIAPDVPDHRRSSDHVRHDPTIRHGGGGTAPHDAGEGRRREHLAQFVRTVADALPATDDLTILGPGTIRERLVRQVRDQDRRLHRDRSITCEAAERLTGRQLIARLNREVGVGPVRRPLA